MNKIKVSFSLIPDTDDLKIIRGCITKLGIRRLVAGSKKLEGMILGKEGKNELTRRIG